MLIFDRFKTREAAESFAAAAKAEYGLDGDVFDSQETSDERDPFPFRLEPFIVLIDRSEPGLEDQVTAAVSGYGGEFAGT